jgi:transposase
MHTCIVGVDIAKKTFDVALPLDGPGKYRTKAKLSNDPLGFEAFFDWLRRHAPGAAICMEATGIYHEALALALVQEGFVVYVINPAQIAAYARSELSRTKSDRTDAKLIARFGVAQTQLTRSLQPWVPPTPAQRRLRALVHRLNDLEGMRQMEANRLDVSEATVVPSIEQVIAALDAQILAVRKEIDDHIDSDPDLRRDRDLMISIPGIGQTTAAYLLGCLGDLRRFAQPGKLDAFVGLNPSIRESGQWKGKTTLSRLGNALLRAKLYMPAMVAVRYCARMQAFYERLTARGKPRKLALAAAMRKLLHIAWGVVRSGRPFDPELMLAT